MEQASYNHLCGLDTYLTAGMLFFQYLSEQKIMLKNFKFLNNESLKRKKILLYFFKHHFQPCGTQL